MLSATKLNSGQTPLLGPRKDNDLFKYTIEYSGEKLMTADTLSELNRYKELIQALLVYGVFEGRPLLPDWRIRYGFSSSDTITSLVCMAIEAQGVAPWSIILEKASATVRTGELVLNGLVSELHQAVGMIVQGQGQ